MEKLYTIREFCKESGLSRDYVLKKIHTEIGSQVAVKLSTGKTSSWRIFGDRFLEYLRRGMFQ